MGAAASAGPPASAAADPASIARRFISGMHGCSRHQNCMANPHARSNCVAVHSRVGFPDATATGRRARDGRRLRKPLLEGHRPAGCAGHLQPLPPQDLRRAVAGAARHRPLRAGLPGRRRSRLRNCTRPIRRPAARTPMRRSSRPSGCSPRRGPPASRSSTPPRTPGRTACRRASPRPSASACRRTRRSITIKAEFKPQPGDVVITKQRASGFYGTPLMAHLTQLGIQTVIVCGESTSGCVRASSVDAYSNGFHVVRGRGMLLRPQHAVAQGQPVRPAPQIHRRDARRRGGGASRTVSP